MPTDLPIDPAIPAIVERVRSSGRLVLKAEPGAGKTTRVPWALLEAGAAGDGEVLVLQPRRLAARLAARRVAEERGEKVGERIGYQVRFEDVAGPRTRLRFMTEGVLTRRLLTDPQLRGVGLVILDEFHERHLDGDLWLALLRRLQLGPRRDLKVVVMSATLDPAPIASFLGGAPMLEVAGRRFEVEVEHQSVADSRPLDQQVAGALKRLLRDGLDGDVLVFLPGAAEIRKAREACQPVAEHADLLLTALHGDLPPAEQDQAVRPASKRKVILSTNVAESSVTIEGVVAVIDSGLARVAGHSAWSGMPTLRIARVSKASAIQRTGRAGRVRAGRCLRLYPRHDFETRPEQEAPEVRRLDLAETALALHGAGVDDLARFDWFEAPSPAAIEAADGLLRRLGALEASGSLTPLGQRMLALPLHPRQARVVLEAEERGRGRDGCVLAALLGEREIRLEGRASFSADRRGARVSGPSDLLESLEAFRQVEKRDFAADAMRSWALDPGAVRAVDKVRRSLERILKPSKRGSDTDPDRPLLIATLAGYPDRVARRRRVDDAVSDDLALAGGGSARLAETSVVREGSFLVAVDAEERERSGRKGVLVRVASHLEPEWLLDLFSDRMRESTELSWNESAERVEAVWRLHYEGLVVEESRSAPDPEAAAAMLAEKAIARGIERFLPEDTLPRLRGRVAFARKIDPNTSLPPLDGEGLRQVIEGACQGCRTFAELEKVGLYDQIVARLSAAQRSALEKLAPERVSLPGGRRVVVHYEDENPWIASRLQDFFGMAQGPAVGGGRVPLVLHLLAPNQRAVQVTTDLAGFWERHYPSIRKELCRKYPRHAWPEDPRTATPPAAQGRGR